jgi:isopentenyl diphosphate isomerase/L-lactate dehydrogenase-like FMN-dependent dehydrogenase
MVERRLPSPKDLAPLMRLKRPELNPKKRRLTNALTVEDLRRIAKRRTPRAAFDYTDGAAEDEFSLSRARQTFRDVTLHPRILRDVSSIDPSVQVLGKKSAWPFGIAPTGFTRMMHTEGEVAGVRAAGRAGIPYSLSTMGTTSIEDVRAAGPDTRKWFQLYMWKDRDRSMNLVQRAADNGFDTLLVTVDVPVAGARLRDTRNGLTIPPTLTPKTIVDAIPRPWWWFDFLTTEPLSFATLDRWSGTVAELLDVMFDPTVDFDDLAWIKDQWPGSLVVKGIQNVEDAKKVASLGVDGIVLSNHGGRQLDGSRTAFDQLGEIVDAVGDRLDVIMDGGVQRGTHVLKALAMGAKAVGLGRYYLFPLAAAGQPGVERALGNMRIEIERDMKLMGTRTVAELSRDQLRFR